MNYFYFYLVADKSGLLSRPQGTMCQRRRSSWSLAHRSEPSAAFSASTGIYLQKGREAQEFDRKKGAAAGPADWPRLPTLESQRSGGDTVLRAAFFRTHAPDAVSLNSKNKNKNYKKSWFIKL